MTWQATGDAAPGGTASNGSANSSTAKRSSAKRGAGKPGLSWGFISFADSISAYINNGGVSHPAFSDINAMNSALATFMASTDVGGTAYRGALAAAHDLPN